ncbi:hypothetical protein PAXINDRAFT_6840 [Paxillus involutus ATCC 200175]|nr:hypothetical protein PAXINDRAFT_6840 [Paxillus involutus ATCC 200175]
MTTIRDQAMNIYLLMRGRRQRGVDLQDFKLEDLRWGNLQEDIQEDIPQVLLPHHLMEGYTSPIWSLAAIPDSTLFVSGSLDGRCKVWCAEDGKETGKEMVHGGSVYAIVVSEDGKMMASGGYDGRIVVWSLESRKRAIEWDTSDKVYSLAMLQDSRTLASGHDDGTVRVWNASTGDMIAGPYQLHDRMVLALSFSLDADGSQIISGGSDGYIRVTHSHSGEDAIPPFKAHEDWIRSLVWMPNGQLISASDDKTIKYWDIRLGGSSQASLLATSHGHNTSVFALAISSDGKLLASVSLNDNTTKLWDTSTYQQIGSVPLHRGASTSSLYAVAFSSSRRGHDLHGHYLAAAGESRIVYIWNIMANARGGISDWSTPPEEKPQSSSGDAVTGQDNEDGDNDAPRDHPKDDARDELDWLDVRTPLIVLLNPH